MRERAERNLLADGGFDVNIFERIGMLLELRVNFENDAILVELRENRRDLPLAERVVESIVNVGGKNPEARRSIGSITSEARSR